MTKRKDSTRSPCDSSGMVALHRDDGGDLSANALPRNQPEVWTLAKKEGLVRNLRIDDKAIGQQRVVEIRSRLQIYLVDGNPYGNYRIDHSG